MKFSPATGTVLNAEEIRKLREKGVEVKTPWAPNRVQRKILHSRAKVILAAGSKGFGKTHGGQLWMLSGNPHLPRVNPDGSPNWVNRSYIYHPKFLGAVIRRNEKDLASWVMDFLPMARAMGMKYTKSPAMFVHPWGGTILLGHAQDKDAWMKWQGQNIIKFLIEEAGQIPDFDTFEELRGCLRSVYPEMYDQMLLTANPGGPGQQWLYDYFIEPRYIYKGEGKEHIQTNPSTGLPYEEGDLLVNPSTLKPYSSGEVIEEKIHNPLVRGEYRIYTRVWITGTLLDNPHALKSDYIYNLASITDPKLRKMYIFGDWKAASGTYFDIFTRQDHTYSPAQLPVQSWWKSFGSLDWGRQHNTAVYWYKKNPSTGQTLVVDEFVINKAHPDEVGAEIARRCLPHLEWQNSISIFVSHDAFQDRIGDLSIVELLMSGVRKILGPNSVHSPDMALYRMRERTAEIGGKWEWNETLDRFQKERRKGINFVRAPRNRGIGFLLVRTMMRTTPIVHLPRPDMELAIKILIDDGLQKYQEYFQKFPTQEILPKLLISQSCKHLIAAIPKAIHSDKDPEDIDPTHFNGMDSLDSLRYGLTGIREEPPSAAPHEVLRDRFLQSTLQSNPSLSGSQLHLALDQFEEFYREDRKQPKDLVIYRGGTDHSLQGIDI